jgi:hypothetical protein
MLESMDALAPRQGCLQSCDVDEFWTSVEPIQYTFLIYHTYKSRKVDKGSPCNPPPAEEANTFVLLSANNRPWTSGARFRSHTLGCSR